MKNKLGWLLSVFLFTNCAGLNRSCSSGIAENFGSDWLVVQYAADGHPINCWKLENTAISNEAASDGIFWVDPRHKHLVHISGWYNRVQVSGSFESAATLIGVELDKCKNGKY